MHRARAIVFKERLNWHVQVHQELELDNYDRYEHPIYVVALNQMQRPVASLRLLPTVGPTMLTREFADVFDEPLDVKSPCIWECTRFCIHPARRSTGRDVASELLFGLYEFCRWCGIEHVLGVCDRRMLRIYSRIGWSPESLATAKFGQSDVILGAWDVTPEATIKLRTRMASSPLTVDLTLLPHTLGCSSIWAL